MATKKSSKLPTGAPNPTDVPAAAPIAPIPAPAGVDPSGLMPLAQPAASAVPRPKVLAAGVAGAITTLAVWGLTSAGIEVTAEVAAAFTTMIAFVAGYFTSDK